MSEWRAATPDDMADVLRLLTAVQESTLLGLIRSMPDARVRIRVLTEFEGQINVPVMLEIVGGTRFMIDAEGSISEYRREDKP